MKYRRILHYKQRLKKIASLSGKWKAAAHDLRQKAHIPRLVHNTTSENWSLLTEICNLDHSCCLKRHFLRSVKLEVCNSGFLCNSRTTESKQQEKTFEILVKGVHSIFFYPPRSCFVPSSLPRLSRANTRFPLWLWLHPVFSNYHLLKASWVHSKPPGGNSICIALRQSHAQVLSC